MNENERERDRQGRQGQREIFIKRGCRKSEGNGKSEGKSVKMRRNRRGILKDGEKKGGRERERKRKVRGESHMLKQKGAEAALILPNTCGFNATQRFFCCCSTRQRFTPMRKAAVTSSQLTESLSSRDKGLESSRWSQALGEGAGGGCCVCVYLCVVSPSTCVYVCGNLTCPFMLYGDIANIVVKGELHTD